MIVPSTFRGKKSAQHDGLVKIGHKNYFQLAKVPAGTVQKKKKKKEIKPITRFQLTSLGRRLFAPSICLSFVQADHFNFGHARDTIIHWLFRPCTKSISLYYVDLNSPGLFSLRLSLSLTPPPLSHPLVIRSAFTGIDCVYRFRCLSWSRQRKNGNSISQSVRGKFLRKRMAKTRNSFRFGKFFVRYGMEVTVRPPRFRHLLKLFLAGFWPTKSFTLEGIPSVVFQETSHRIRNFDSRFRRGHLPPIQTNRSSLTFRSTNIFHKRIEKRHGGK